MGDPEHHMCLLFLAGRCEPVPHVQNAAPDSLMAHDGTRIHYSCVEGHVFTDSSNVTVAECRQQTWIYDRNKKCQRESITHPFDIYNRLTMLVRRNFQLYLS